MLVLFLSSLYRPNPPKSLLEQIQTSS